MRELFGNIQHCVFFCSFLSRKTDFYTATGVDRAKELVLLAFDKHSASAKKVLFQFILLSSIFTRIKKVDSGHSFV